MASLPSADQNHYTYEVFLSFRGEDTRFGFTDHLYKALCDRGINTFRDDDELRKGEELAPALIKAIEESRTSIIVFSENYASSKWCLDELVKILECRKSKRQEVRSVFYKVDPSHVRHQPRSTSFGEAFAKLECRHKDRMDEWKKALKEAADLCGWTFKEGEYEAPFINKIVGELSARVVIPSYELPVAEHPVGIESCRREIDSLLDVEEENAVRMVGIWGTGGIGKTTIAKAVFNSISRKFEGSCFLAVDGTNSSPDQSLAKLQETLLFKILGNPALKVHDVHEGISFIKNRMQKKKVLLILDDVSHSNQLKKLAPSSDCFGAGSRIIITTRDKRWLIAHQVDSIYDVNMLDGDRALELFSWNAFRRNGPPDDYVELAQHAVRYAQGLPLALIVFGSHLFKRSRDEWEAILNSCKGDPQREIQSVLRSYDALDVCVKELFLDIACFFKGAYVDDVTPILQACGRNPVIGMKLLVEKALIIIESNDSLVGTSENEFDQIWMHDLIEEMGKDIVIQVGEPGKRSRLWNLDDVNHVLTNNTGTDKIKGIQVPWQWKPDDICLNVTSFSKLKNLMYFSSSYGARYSGNIDYLSHNLRWLDWFECPLQSFPSDFHPKELVALNIENNSSITRLWNGRKICPNLTSMKLMNCESLMELPDFTGIPNLKELILEGCESLVELHDSVGSLDRLETLNASGCSELVKFPSEISWKSLQIIDLRNCYKLITFPTNTKSLHDDNGDGSLALPKLKVLSMGSCYLSDVDFLTTLDCLETLTKLDLSGNSFVSLPACISKFVNLETLGLCFCPRLREIPELPPNLVEVDVSGCLSLEKFWKLSKVLEGKESQGIKWIDLRNCYRLCDNLGYNMDKMEHILLNNQDNASFRVVFPGHTSEVPKCFNCWKDIIGPTGGTFDCEFYIKISENLKWEKIGLAICVITEGSKPCRFDYEVSINEVCIRRSGLLSSLPYYVVLSTTDNVCLDYIPLPVERKAKVDDQKGCSSPQPYYMCRVRFRHEIPKGCGIHLVCQESKDDEYSSNKVGGGGVESTEQKRYRTDLRVRESSTKEASWT